ncbi:acyl-CoA carboxylase subunit epsilon [Streptomyces netropsis]|uniref:Acyl-CoA carboxylase subunit epsilon n=1 Tax=Streptomyces netropsis TaxID=55404 RepID=A0A7W7LE28_STRNE|nr:acyl-CoA carboxylase subunit epsilon [Streptomyces netropsis]MBB4888492.1 hypothetical protein [Streptomyces netropsis]GGR28885.1 hypothetical protein GCM10010219_37020 [Streptomyces netropsis]
MTQEKAPTALRGPLGPSLLKVIGGNPTQEELAAVTAVLVALSARQERQPVAAGAPAAARWQRAGARGRPPGARAARS